jgi:hypothetical protein
MAPSELMRKFVDVLEDREIPYFVTGSMASITYGDPRFTNDIDAVVQLPVDQVDAFCAAFSAPEYYCSRDAILLAIQQRFQFNVIHLKSGFKIDVIIPADTEFSRSCFARRARVVASDGKAAWFGSPEDVILSKMLYFKEGESYKHVRDIVGILKVQAEKVDRTYIQEWAERLQLAEIWADIAVRADQPQVG